jgi:hypothetical protein
MTLATGPIGSAPSLSAFAAAPEKSRLEEESCLAEEPVAPHRARPRALNHLGRRRGHQSCRCLDLRRIGRLRRTLPPAPIRPYTVSPLLHRDLRCLGCFRRTIPPRCPAPWVAQVSLLRPGFWVKRGAAVPGNKANRGNREVTYGAFSAFFFGKNPQGFAGRTPRPLVPG